MFIPEGEFKFRVGRGNFEPVIAKFGGKDALTQWEQLLRKLEPIQKLSVSIPPLALRSDVFSAVTLLPYLDKLITGAPVASAVQGPIKNVYKDFLTDKFLVS